MSPKISINKGFLAMRKSFLQDLHKVLKHLDMILLNLPNKEYGLSILNNYIDQIKEKVG